MLTSSSCCHVKLTLVILTYTQIVDIGKGTLDKSQLLCGVDTLVDMQ